jgi:hypothetical protein
MRPMTRHELMGRAHATAATAWNGNHAPESCREAADAGRHTRASGRHTRASGRHPRAAAGQGTVEYVGLILLVAVLIAGVVQASRSFSDTGIAEAVVKKIKGAIDGVADPR